MRMGSVNSDLWHAAVVSQEASGLWRWEARCGAWIARQNKHTDTHELSLVDPERQCSRCVALLAREAEEARRIEAIASAPAPELTPEDFKAILKGLGEIDRKRQAAANHWKRLESYEVSACGSLFGTRTARAMTVTCFVCREAPGYREKLLEEVRDEIVHHSLPVDPASVAGAWPVACGSNKTLKGHADLSRVTCLDCIRAGVAPKVDKPPQRRILLQGDDG